MSSRVPAPKCSRAAAGVPKNASRPPGASTATLSHRSASVGLCVVTTTVVPASASPRRVLISSAPRAGSRPDVGSSRKNSLGPASSSDAIEARLRSPPDSWPTGTSERPVSSSVRSSLVDRAAGDRSQRGRIAEGACKRQSEVDDVVLGDVADVAGNQAHRPGRRWPQTAHRVEQRGLARAAAADNRHQFPGVDGERHIMQRDYPRLGPLSQLAYLDRRLHDDHSA